MLDCQSIHYKQFNLSIFYSYVNKVCRFYHLNQNNDFILYINKFQVQISIFEFLMNTSIQCNFQHQNMFCTLVSIICMCSQTNLDNNHHCTNITYRLFYMLDHLCIECIPIFHCILSIQVYITYITCLSYHKHNQQNIYIHSLLDFLFDHYSSNKLIKMCMIYKLNHTLNKHHFAYKNQYYISMFLFIDPNNIQQDHYILNNQYCQNKLYSF